MGKNSDKVYEVLAQVSQGMSAYEGWEQLWGVIDAADERDRLAVNNENLRGINARMKDERDHELDQARKARQERDRYAERTRHAERLLHGVRFAVFSYDEIEPYIGRFLDRLSDTESPEPAHAPDGPADTWHRISSDIDPEAVLNELSTLANNDYQRANIEWLRRYIQGNDSPEGSGVSSGQSGDALVAAEESLRFLENDGYRVSPRLVRHHHDIIRQALTASGVPDGYKLVPVEPTHKSIGQGIMAYRESLKRMNYEQLLTSSLAMRCAYRAMIAAAPEAGREPKEDSEPSQDGNLNSNLDKALDCLYTKAMHRRSLDNDDAKEIAEAYGLVIKALRDRQRVPGQPDIGVIIAMVTKYNEIYRKSKDAGRAMRAAIDAWKERAIARAEGQSDE